MKPLITIYGKPECCLCDDALEMLYHAPVSHPAAGAL